MKKKFKYLLLLIFFTVSFNEAFSEKNNKHVFCEKPFTCSYKEANFICNLIVIKKIIVLKC